MVPTGSPTLSSRTPPDKKIIRRVIVASLIGSTIEWYDWFLYGTMAGIVFNKIYFATTDAFTATILAYFTFYLGFLTRPVGAIIFGHFGDRIGRKNVLVLTLLVMGIGTVGIGLVPTYAQIGIFAPILLTLMRMMQGLGIGGEWGGSVLMTFEYASPLQRGLYASFPQIGLGLGVCLSTGVTTLLSVSLSDAQFIAWGWRIGFLLSVVLILVGLWIRVKVTETPEFEALKEKKEISTLPFKDMWRKGGVARVIAGLGIRYVEGVTFSTFGIYSIAYLTDTVKMARSEALATVTAAGFVMCFFLPAFGSLADRVGKAKLYLYASLVIGCSAFPAFWLMGRFHPFVTWMCVIITFGIFWAAIFGPEAALLAELFDTRVRYTGLSFTYQLSTAFAGGITPLVNTYLVHKFSGFTGVSIYCFLAGCVSAIAALWVMSHQKQQRILHDPAQVTTL